MDKAAMLLEAHKRGILPPDMAARVEEAMKRGLLQAPSQAAQDTAKWEEGIRKGAAPSKLERFGRGFADITQGVKQGALMVKDLVTGGDEANVYTADKSEELARYEGNRGPDAGMDLMRLGGNVAATLPISMLVPGSAAPALGTRMASGAAQGALASGAMFTPEGHSKGEQIAIGTLVGGAVPAAVEGVKRGATGILDRIRPPAQGLQQLQSEVTIALQKQGMDWNKLTAEAQKRLLADAKTALETGGTLDDIALANKASIESIPGAKATKASVTRAPRDWQTEKNLRGIQGVGDEIVSREQGNAKAMTEYLQQLRAQTGAKATTSTEAGESAVNAVRVADNAKEKAVGELYGAYRDSGQGKLTVPETRLTEKLTGILEEIGQENIPPAVQTRLKEFGFLGGQRARYLTVDEADKFNRLLNANNPGHGASSKVIGQLKGALNESLLETPGGGEMLTKAREAAAQRFAEQRASSGITAAVDDVAPDKFVQRFVLGADARDLRGTMAELKKTNLGQQAIKDIKGTVLDTLLMKATNSTSVDDVVFKSGNNAVQFSGKSFAKALDGIAPEKLHQLFSPTEVQALRQLQKASKLLTEEVPFSDVNYSKTTAALANLLLKVGNTPLLGKLASPILGTAKLGLDWIENAEARKQVAEALIASAAKAGPGKRLPVSGVERFLPAPAAAAVLEAER